MRKDPRPVNDRDLFEDRNALTGDGPEGKLLGPIGTFRHRARYLALLLGFSAASRRYLAKHPGLRWLQRAVYFVLVYLLLSSTLHTICQNISGHPPALVGLGRPQQGGAGRARRPARRPTDPLPLPPRHALVGAPPALSRGRALHVSGGVLRRRGRARPRGSRSSSLCLTFATNVRNAKPA